MNVFFGDYCFDIMVQVQSDQLLLKGGDVDGQVNISPGGSVANTVVWAKRCGLDSVTFVGKIGRDYFGHLARENLKEERIEAIFIEDDTRSTQAVAVWVDASGQRSCVTDPHAADHNFLPNELPISVLKSSSHMHFSGWSLFEDPPRSATISACECIHDATVSFDPSSFQMIKRMGQQPFLELIQGLGIDLIFPNQEEGEVMSGCSDPIKIAAFLQESLHCVVLLKLGVDGVLVWTKEGEGAFVRLNGVVQRISNPKDSVKLNESEVTLSEVSMNKDSIAIDTTGAGDSFAGSFLSVLLSTNLNSSSTSKSTANSWTLDLLISAARYANEVAQIVVHSVGARPQLSVEKKQKILDLKNDLVGNSVS